MARFVDLDDEDSQVQPLAAWQEAGKPLASPENGPAVMIVGDGDRSVIFPTQRFPSRKSTMTDKPQQQNEDDAFGVGKGKGLAAHSAMEEAFQCYPYDAP
jgi:hypothetical protein